MITTPAHKGGWFGRTHRTALLWEAGPSDGLQGRSVRTCSSNAELYQFIATLSHSWSTAISTANCCSDRRRQRRSQLRAEAGACPRPDRRSRTRMGRQRVCCKAQCRLSDCCSPSTAAVVGAGWLLSISCTCAKVTPEKQQTEGRADKLGVSA